MKVGQIWSVENGGQKYGVRVTGVVKYEMGGIESVDAHFIKPKVAGFTHVNVWNSDITPHPPHWTLIEDVP